MRNPLRTSLFGISIATLLMASPAAHASLNQAQRMQDFTQMVNTVERNYIALRWKQQTIGLDFNKLIATYAGRVKAAKSDGEFTRILAQFLSEFQDGHVQPAISSNFQGSLGFTVDLIQGKVLIDTINTQILPGALFPFSHGDQLISLGGVPVETLMTELAKTQNTGNPLTTQRIAAGHLTSRSEDSGFEVPTGLTTATVLPKGATEPVTVTLVWVTRGTPITDLDDMSNLLGGGQVLNPIPSDTEHLSVAQQLKSLSVYQQRISTQRVQDWQRAGLSDVGNATPMFQLPKGATDLGLGLPAYIFEVAGKKIGLIRIASFSDNSLVGNLSQALFALQATTDVLVIDETNNPGGDVATVSSVIGMFANKSFKDMTFELRDSLNWLKRFEDINAKLDSALAENSGDAAGNALKPRFLVLQDMIQKGIEQKQFSTPAVSLNFTSGFGMIQPGNPNYTKPVLLLTNEFDFSAADIFPAVMQDNGRVTIFGEKTNGAGGNVTGFGPLANSNMSFNLTEGLMVRPNGQYVENRGIEPNIHYSVTEDDFNNGYRNYVRAFSMAAVGLVGVSPQDFQAWEAAQKAKPPTAPAPTQPTPNIGAGTGSPN